MKEAPKGRHYTKTHEWVSVVKGNLVRIGITQYAAHELGDLTSVEVREVGREIRKEESFGTIESAKAVEYLYSPVSGKITGVNKGAGVAEEGEMAFGTGELERIPEDPYGDGWIVEVDASSLEEDMSDLMTADEYDEYLKEIS